VVAGKAASLNIAKEFKMLALADSPNVKPYLEEMGG
jgi:hypothetical protein